MAHLCVDRRTVVSRLVLASGLGGLRRTLVSLRNGAVLDLIRLPTF
jgi:hypothetical protein